MSLVIILLTQRARNSDKYNNRMVKLKYNTKINDLFGDLFQ